MARQLGSKRGYYANLNATAGKKEGVWEVNKVKIPKELAETNKKREVYNKQIADIKQLLLSKTNADERTNFKVSREKEDNVERWINQRIYGTKPKGGTERVKEIADKNIDVNYEIHLLHSKQNVLKHQIETLSKEKDKERSRQLKANIKGMKEGIKSSELRLSKVLDPQEQQQLKEGKREFPNPERTIKVGDLLNEGKTIYANRKKYDEESKRLRAGYNNENRAYKRIYDIKRYAGKNKKARVWINGKEFLASQITETMSKSEKERLDQLSKKKKLSTRRKVKTHDGKIVYINEVEEYKQLKEKDKQKGYILPKGVISGWHIGAKGTFDISSTPPSKTILIAKEKLIIPKQDKITFEQDSSGRIFTESNIKLIFDKAEKQTGQRVIFINNQAMTETDFIEEKPLIGRTLWYISPSAFTEIQEGVSDLSFVYNPSYTLRTNELVRKRVEVAQKPILKELNSTLMIGGKNQKVHILIYTIEALRALKEARARRKNGENVSWLATQYTLTENMSKSERARLETLNKKLDISLTDKEREELVHLRELDKINIVVEVQGAKVMNDTDLAMYQEAHSEYVALSWAYDKDPKVWIFGVAIKMNTEESVAGAVEYVG